MNEQNKKALKTMVFAQSFVEALDDFGGTTAFKQQIKLKGLALVKEVDKYLNTVYKDGGAERPLIDIIQRCQDVIDEVIDNEIVVTD
tara:strand:- start:533 stop:793 length:261 start_codon:yes stop_codon:yes gene_type:complete